MQCCYVLFESLILGFKSYSPTYWPGIATTVLRSDKTGEVEKIKLKEKILDVSTYILCFSNPNDTVLTDVYFQCLFWYSTPS